MAHHVLRYFILACFLVISFLFVLAFLDTLIDEKKILATPTISKKKAVFTALATTRINASAKSVFNVLLDFENYSKWNTHVPECKWEKEKVTADGVPLVGAKGQVKVQLSGYKPITSSVQFTMIDRQTHTMASRESVYPAWVLKAERVQEVSYIKKDLCEFRTWETFGGLLSVGFYVKYVSASSIVESGRRSAENLKNYVEDSQGTSSSDSLLYH